MTRALGIAEFASATFEADDVIATLAATGRGLGLRSVVVSADKDLTQVVRGRDQWWDFARKRRLDARGVLKQWGVRPDQIADLLALTGDKVDNIPGIPGVGTTTAARLLTRWDNLDGIYANLAQVASMKFRGAARVAALLDEHQATVRLARRLTATLNVPGLPTAAEALAPGAPDRDALEALFEQFGFSPPRRERWHRLLAER